MKVPVIGESISEVTLSAWLKENGEYVNLDDPICEFESDKATLEFPAEAAGKLIYVAAEGDDIEIGALVAKIDTSVTAPAGDAAPAAPAPEKKEEASTAPVPAPAAISNASGHLLPLPRKYCVKTALLHQPLLVQAKEEESLKKTHKKQSQLLLRLLRQKHRQQNLLPLHQLNQPLLQRISAEEKSAKK